VTYLSKTAIFKTLSVLSLSPGKELCLSSLAGISERRLSYIQGGPN